MKTSHRIIHGDARDLSEIENNSVHLVVTSPPYPMIEMWDDTFTLMNEEINDYIEKGDGSKAFELMHRELDKVWKELERVVVEGGIVCINIGDATRTIDNTFKLWPNHTRITEWFRQSSFNTLPNILWRKPTNKSSKFMGSGMRPPNAYVTMERENILIFRKGDGLRKGLNPEERSESAYFWDERNKWFSDFWDDVPGTRQHISASSREKSASYPFEIPYRLINMFSVQSDVVLDPFLGTGTTSLAAISSARNSIGIEIDKSFLSVIDERIDGIKELTEQKNASRIDSHRANLEGDEEYEANNYNVSTRTKQETDILLYNVDRIESKENEHIVKHQPYNP